MKSIQQEQESPDHSRAVIWIDHLRAKIFSMGLSGVTPSVVHAHLSSAHLHHKANTIGTGRVQDDPTFLEQVAKAIASCTEVLILGPGTEKTALRHHLQDARPDIVLRAETIDHPSDAEIIALGRRHFRLG